MLNGTFWLPVWDPRPHVQGNSDTGALICPLESGGAAAVAPTPETETEAEQPAAVARVRRSLASRPWKPWRPTRPHTCPFAIGAGIAFSARLQIGRTGS